MANAKYISVGTDLLKIFNSQARTGLTDEKWLSYVDTTWPNFRELFGGAVVFPNLDMSKVRQIILEHGRRYQGKGLPNRKGLQNFMEILNGAAPLVSLNPLKIGSTVSAITKATSEGVSDAAAEIGGGLKKGLYIAAGIGLVYIAFQIWLAKKTLKRLA